MSEQRPDQDWEDRLRDAARRFDYPPTPDLAGSVRRRLVAEAGGPASGRGWARPGWRYAAGLAVLLLALLAVPEVRAGVRRLLGLGSIRFVYPTATPVVPTPLPATATAAGETRAPDPTLPPVPTGTPAAAPTRPSARWTLAGETTLADARSRVGFPIRLPTYPADLGPPDRVYVQQLDGPAVILAWFEPGSTDQVRLSVHALSSEAIAHKLLDDRSVLEETTVNGQRAIWVQGPHVLLYTGPGGVQDLREGRLVEGHVLIWREGDITYRVEGDLTLEEAARIATSLR